MTWGAKTVTTSLVSLRFYTAASGNFDGSRDEKWNAGYTFMWGDKCWSPNGAVLVKDAHSYGAMRLE
jgi:hypothetical protein